MNREAIRRKTCIIIRKNNAYLRGRDMLTKRITWTWSSYEAWRTRNREEAEVVARATGGIMVLFNPILNQRRVLGA